MSVTTGSGSYSTTMASTARWAISAVDGGDGGDDLALEAHDVAGEQRAVLHERAEAHVGHVVGGQHGEHAGHRPRGRDVELGDPARAMTSAYRNLAASMPVSVRSAVYRPLPVTLSGPSARTKRG